MTEATQGAASEAPPVCPRHTDRISYVRCQRCERPTCPQCQVAAPVGVLCVDCVRAAEKTAGGARARAAAASGRGAGTATKSLIGANVAFYLYGLATGISEWHIRFGLVPLLRFREPWRLITSGFVSYGPSGFGLLNFGITMWLIYRYGSQLEAALGWKRFSVLYGAALLTGSIASALFAPALAMQIGATNAVLGLLTGTAVLLHDRRLPWQGVAVVAAIWLVLSFSYGVGSWEGRAGGAVAGAVTMWVILALERVKRRP